MTHQNLKHLTIYVMQSRFQDIFLDVYLQTYLDKSFVLIKSAKTYDVYSTFNMIVICTISNM